MPKLLNINAQGAANERPTRVDFAENFTQLNVDLRIFIFIYTFFSFNQ
jgi:hypothetical protein